MQKKKKTKKIKKGGKGSKLLDVEAQQCRQMFRH